MPATRDTLRTATLTIIALILAWQCYFGISRLAGQVVRELGMVGMFDSEEQRLERDLGSHYASRQALLEIVPERALVYCNLIRSDPVGGMEDIFLLQRLRHSLHPRILQGLDFRDPSSRAMLAADPAKLKFELNGWNYGVFVCDFRPELDGDPPAPLQLLHRTDLFEIWGLVP